MKSLQHLTTPVTHQQRPILQQKPSIKAKQKPIQSKQGKKPRHKAKQQPVQRNRKQATVMNDHLGEAQIKENVSQLMGTDVTDAKVHYNSSKPAQLQAEATAQGAEVHLAPGKEQHLGHELTHVAQQKQGRVQPTVQANNGVGINDDPALEKEADQIGEKATKGQIDKAKDLALKGMSTHHHTTPVQRYVKYSEKDQKGKRKKSGQWRHPQGESLYVSNDGSMAVEGKGKNSIQAWATQGLINQANAKLKANNSYVELKPDTNDLKIGKIPNQGEDHPPKTNFKKIIPVKRGTNKPMTEAKNTTPKELNVFTGTGKGRIEPTKYKRTKLRDCSNTNELMMGSRREGEMPTRRVYKRPGDEDKRTYDVNKTIQEVIKKALGKEFKKGYSLEEALKVYKNLKPNDKKQFDEKYGLDTGARPSLGQGVTTVLADPNSDKGGFNFHFGTNIMDSENGEDYMTLEGLVGHNIWFFAMYGTQEGQSFHDRQKDKVQKPNISAVVDKER